MHPIFDDFDRSLQRRGMRLMERVELEETIPYRKKAEKLFIGLSLLCSISYFFTSCLSIVESEQKKEARQFRFLQKWLARYFYTRGIRHYKTRPYPKNPDKPVLIILPRYTEILSLFVLTLFDFPVILPMSPAMSAFRIHYRLPDPLSKLLKKIGIPDRGLNQDVERISTLLKQGYCVVAHPNEGFFNANHLDTLQVHSELVSLFNLKDIDTYFLSLEGAHTYVHCSYYLPTQFRCALEPPEYVFMVGTRHTDQEKIALMSQFFGANRIQIIIPN